MRRLLYALVTLTACLPTPAHDCITRGGLYVRGGLSCDDVQVVQTRIETHAARLNTPRTTLSHEVLYVRTEGLTPEGGFTDPRFQGQMAGVSYCESSMMIVAYGPDVERLEQTSFAHEAFHILEGCPFISRVYDECMARDNNIHGCYSVATHPNWYTNGVYAAIQDINGGGL